MHARWQSTALSGDGAAMYPGRWNKPGSRMVYVADSLALAVLETLVHLEAEATEEPYVGIELSIPDGHVTRLTDLPADWKQNMKATRDLGGRWLTTRRTLAAQVPSALVPDGTNLLLNPAHPSFGEVRELRRVEFHWDARLF